MRFGAVLALTLALALPAGVALGVDDSDTATAIRKVLQSRYKDIQIIDVQASPIAGLYEVYTGDTIAYSNATGDYLIVGSILDTRSRRDLTATRLDERNAIDFDSLPVAQAIKVVKGNGSRKVAVFSDPDCPFCQRLEKTFADITDVTIYTYLYPIDSLHPDASNKARAIWCANKREEVWTRWMTEKKAAPAAPASCKDDPIAELQALGEKLRVNSTPTLVFSSGRRVSGALDARRLEVALNEGRLKK